VLGLVACGGMWRLAPVRYLLFPTLAKWHGLCPLVGGMLGV